MGHKDRVTANMGSGIPYRERATECLRIAESIIDEGMKTIWAKLAAEWIALAEQIERKNVKLDHAAQQMIMSAQEHPVVFEQADEEEFVQRSDIDEKS